jgi:lysozyme
MASGAEAMRKTNQNGIDLIKQWEGLYLTAYHGAADRPGLLTIGYGHTDAAGPPMVKAGMTITAQEAENILRNDLSGCEAAVERIVTVALNDNQFAALVSFVFNVGEANFKSSTLLRKLNAEDYASVPAELMKWTKANGKRVQGLANRRAAEGGLWVKGAPVESQYVEPEAKPETVTSSLTKPETIATVVGSASGVVAAISGATGPVGYALAAVIVIAALVAGYWIIKNIKERGT